METDRSLGAHWNSPQNSFKQRKRETWTREGSLLLLLEDPRLGEGPGAAGIRATSTWLGRRYLGCWADRLRQPSRWHHGILSSPGQHMGRQPGCRDSVVPGPRLSVMPA